jgi:hypothetical protein
MKKNNAGGKREGAGRPKGEPKKAIGLRVPLKYHKRLTDLLYKELKKLK